jgi:hypothetical protein
MSSPTESRLQYLASRTDAELETLLAENERALGRDGGGGGRKEGRRLEHDRTELLDEMRRRPVFDPHRHRTADALDRFCPNCQSMPGERCTQPTRSGRRDVGWFHLARVDATAE